MEAITKEGVLDKLKLGGGIDKLNPDVTHQKPILLDAPGGVALSAALGGEAVPQPSMAYKGADRILSRTSGPTSRPARRWCSKPSCCRRRLRSA